MYAGKKFEVEIDGYDNYLRLVDNPDGFIQLSAHIGNYEIAGYTLKAEKKKFNALVFFGEGISHAQSTKIVLDYEHQYDCHSPRHGSSL